MTAEIKPLEKKKRHIKGYIPKLIFLISLLCIGLIISIMARNTKKDQPTVLGANDPPINLSPAKDVKNIMGSVTQQSRQIVSSIIDSTSDIISDTASRSAAVVSQTIYDNTFGKLVDQIKNLPSDQQTKIKEQICK